MFSTAWFRLAAFAIVSLLSAATAGAQAIDPTTLYRLFLRDGSTIVSYGEYARVADKVVISLPLGGTPAAPELQLLSLPADAIDWDKTDAYAESARAARYAQTRGPDDFAMLNQAVSVALSDIALTADPQRKIAMAAEARQNVTKWAAEHYGYRASSVADLAGLFDQVIAETRAAGGASNVDMSLVANMAEPPSVALLPVPTPRETIEQSLTAVTLAPDAAERTSLLRAIQKTLASVSPGEEWAAPLAARAAAALAAEERTDRAYAALGRDSLQLADRYVRVADVTGVERVTRQALREDDRLGQKRPNEMASLLAVLDARLDAARKLRLARDSYAARVDLLRAYERAVAGPLAAVRVSRAPLDEIRRLAGPSRLRLTRLSRQVAGAITQMATVTVPPEAAAAHDQLHSAFELAARAVNLRQRAIAAGDMQLAWQASSAAAGALLLFDQAAEGLRGVLKVPTAK